MLPKNKLKDREVLDKILALLEGDGSGPIRKEWRVYNTAQIKELLGIHDKYLRKLRDNGYLGYSPHGDKYWYTQEDVEKFLRRFHYRDFATSSRLPSV